MPYFNFDNNKVNLNTLEFWKIIIDEHKFTDLTTEGRRFHQFYTHKIKMPEQKQKKDVPACCVGCVRWEKFGKNCWYYWEGKKHCTMWIGSWDEVVIQ